jgi:hypothetical protein
MSQAKAGPEKIRDCTRFDLPPLHKNVAVGPILQRRVWITIRPKENDFTRRCGGKRKGRRELSPRVLYVPSSLRFV